MLIRPCDIPNKNLYYSMLCQELDKMGLERRVTDISKQYLYEIFFCEE